MFSADLGGYTAPPATNDPPFQKVALLLHGDGTNGAQNNTFVDSSSNNFTITRTGNVAQGTFSPFSLAEGQWSNHFEGTTSYLTVPSTISFGPIGSTPFTIETWVYPTKKGGWIFSGTQGDKNNLICQFFLGSNPDSTSSTNYVGLGWYGWAYVTSSAEIPLNTWTHIAGVFTGSATKIYINGVEDTTGTLTSWSSAAGSSYYIGSKWGLQDQNGGQFRGNLSNLRIVKGTALYTTNFTPPTSPLIAIPGTVLLTCQSNRFKDNSSNNSTITPAGGTKVTAFSPFAPSAAYDASTNGGSGYFDGSGDYLSVANNTNLIFGTSAFTIQCWVYRNVAGVAHSIVSKGGASTGFTFGITSTNVLRFTNTTTNIDTTTTIPAGTWTHVAAVRTSTSSNGFQLYINGVSSATSTVSTDFNQTDTLYVGADRGAANAMNGYITDMRYVNGTAETITVPTSPLTAVSGTSLLLNCTNAGIYDNSGKNDIETVGNAQISTGVKKYGTGSLEFDGSGDWLLLADRPELQLGTGNFTVEGWLYLGATGAARGIVGKGTSTTGWLLSTNSSNQVVFTYESSTITSTGTLAGSTWYHIAVCREGTGTNQTKIYINGTNDGTGTVNTNFNQTNVMYVGANRTGGDAMNGYIDDLRITKGQALYTSNFTPPTQAFPNV